MENNPTDPGTEIVLANKYADESENIVESDQQQKQLQTIVPSYQAKQNIKSVLLLSEQDTNKDVNSQYIRSRRYDNAGKYRIGPTFITKQKLGYMDENKPGKLSVVPNDIHSNNLEFGLLTYLWTFTDQHDKQEIDLGFLKSLIDSGVDINAVDEHGQTILHAIVRDWHPDVALFVIRHNCDVNAQDKYGRSPLHLAAALNNLQMVKLLVMNGSDVNLESSKEMQTPVHYAAKYNSMDALKVLIKYQGSITKRDYKDRTALFLAAEKGSAETAQFLLDIGAPVGVYDNNGNSALTCLIERIPNVGYLALEQFQTQNVSLKQSYLYLGHLETDTLNKGLTDGELAQSPLQIITAFDDVDLIMHPVIQKCVEMKWVLFGRKDTLKELFVTLVYLTCWLVLAYTYSDKGEYYYANEAGERVWHTHSWKILFEALIVIFALYFFLKEFLIKKEAIQSHHRWIEWKQHIVRAQYIFCHPAWPGERESLEAEAERIRNVPTLSGKHQFWFIYEILILCTVATCIILRIVTISVGPSSDLTLFLIEKVIFGVSMILSFLRLLKICVRFRFFAVFLRVTGLAVSSFIQIGFLYLQFYIPFVASFWLMFGGKAGVDLFRGKLHQNKTYTQQDLDFENSIKFGTLLENVFYFVYESSFGQDFIYMYTEVDKELAQVLVSLYHICTTFIALSIFVAFVTSQFTTNYRRCVAEASLLQAFVVLQVEKGLSKRDKDNVQQYYAKFCRPFVSSLTTTSEDIRERDALSKLELTERHIKAIEKNIKEAEERHRQNDRKSHQNLFESILGCTSDLGQRQDVLRDVLKKDLKDITDKQNYMNRYLGKLLV